ncbi:PAS-domain containing protein [Ruegeria pomeroyi]|nr:PAS-domain containing protein [Ruegeria pomeroyi]MCE8522264.1 PAS-domain containing protein [Ruegeria pomeroyi]MCE8529686.1 PAS-domain containing protein [Ruegeria pomeroyi]MCE8534265.1 PAS-domain containing protein [Ruegeria pomeroyi]MCE8544403.1 PAS-domain containing protein [Ruegeria pomeroyi]
MVEWLALAAICLLSAGLTGRLLSKPAQSRQPIAPVFEPGSGLGHVFLFDGTDMIGASHAGEDKDIQDWHDLRERLANEFPGFPSDPDHIERQGQLVVAPIDGRNDRDVFCEWIDGIVRVELRRHCDALANDPRASDADPLRLAMDQAPYPVWYLDSDGNIRWCNAAYVMLARKVRGRNPELFDPLFPDRVDIGAPAKKARISIAIGETDAKLWFDVVIVKQNAGCLCYAMDINAVVDAEIAQRNFVQTLAKTFAQLSIGLAIFDRNRQLALFNPALIDLTCLPADFLSSRPEVSSFFDRLRNLNMMPEPKNYGGWRQQMNDLLQAASSGNYQETWSLPSGSVYSVSGRPHPDGAVAFLFEDITAEITLTRRFRSELELGQAVLDHLDAAIAVFAADGSLAFSNAAYHRLWKSDPDLSFAQVTIVDATRTWQDLCAATPLWGEIRDFVESRENRAEWGARVQLRSGAHLICTVSPIQNGSTLVSFSAPAETAARGPAHAGG